MFRIVSCAILVIGCASGPPTFDIYQSRAPGAIRELMRENPEYFSNDYTLLVIVDGSQCPKALEETVRWSEWKATAADVGAGFVFATSRADSAGLLWTMQLDSVDAPVLVMPGSEDSLGELGIVGGVIPMKALVDSGGTILRCWSRIDNKDESDALVAIVDSLCRSRGSSLNRK